MNKKKMTRLSFINPLRDPRFKIKRVPHPNKEGGKTFHYIVNYNAPGLVSQSGSTQSVRRQFRSIVRWASEMRSELRDARERSRTLRTTHSPAGFEVIAGAHISDGEILNRFIEKRKREFFQPKSLKTIDPDNKKRFVGIELECVVWARDRKELGKRFYDMDPALYKNVNITSDGSIRVGDGNSGAIPCELTILSELDSYRSVLKKVLGTLQGKSFVNDSCGFHFHIDMRKFFKNMAQLETPDFDGIARVYKNLVAAHRSLSVCLPAKRLTSHFCKPNRTLDFEMEYIVNGDRYHQVNIMALAKHRTIEIRSHSGTLNGEKISRWIDVFHAAAEYPGEIQRAPLSPWHLCERLSLPSSYKDYFYRRMKLFSEGEKDDELKTSEIGRGNGSRECVDGSNTRPIEEDFERHVTAIRETNFLIGGTAREIARATIFANVHGISTKTAFRKLYGEGLSGTSPRSGSAAPERGTTARLSDIAVTLDAIHRGFVEGAAGAGIDRINTLYARQRGIGVIAPATVNPDSTSNPPF